MIIVLSTGDHSGLGASLVRGFQSLGIESALLREPTTLLSPLRGVALEAGPHWPSFLVPFRQVLRTLMSMKPQLIVIVKGSFLDTENLKHLRNVAPVVCWNPDSPFDSARSNRGGMIHECISHYDAYVTWSESLANILRDLRPTVFVIPFGFDPTIHYPTPPDDSVEGRIVFIGTYSPERLRMMRLLSSAKPIVYGNGWPPEMPNVRPPIVGERFAAIAAGAKWCLNPLRPQNRDSHNMRTFELLAVSANQLTLDTPDHRRFLRDSTSRLATSIDDLVQIATDENPPRESFSMPGGQTYADRCRDMLSQLHGQGLGLGLASAMKDSSSK